MKRTPGTGAKPVAPAGDHGADRRRKAIAPWLRPQRETLAAYPPARCPLTATRVPAVFRVGGVPSPRPHEHRAADVRSVDSGRFRPPRRTGPMSARQFEPPFGL